MDLSALNANDLAMVLQHNHERWRHEDNQFITQKIKELRRETEDDKRKYTNAQVYYAMIATGEQYAENIKSIPNYDTLDTVRKEENLQNFVNSALPKIAEDVKESHTQEDIRSKLQKDEEKMMGTRYGTQVGVDTVV